MCCCICPSLAFFLSLLCTGANGTGHQQGGVGGHPRQQTGAVGVGSGNGHSAPHVAHGAGNAGAGTGSDALNSPLLAGGHSAGVQLTAAGAGGHGGKVLPGSQFDHTMSSSFDHAASMGMGAPGGAPAGSAHAAAAAGGPQAAAAGGAGSSAMTDTTQCCGGSDDASGKDKRSANGASLNPSLVPDDFELLKVVGKGSFGKVFQVRKKDSGKIYAMKVLKKEQLVKRKQVAHTQTERKVLEEIDHPFIVSLRFAFQTQDKLYMVLDYFTGGELFYHLKANGRFSEELARFYAAEITLALECLHSHTIVYRDLKPENVLLDEEGHIRLTDFGLSKDSISGTTLTHTFCGTPEYLAPEVIQGAGYNKSVDWWSLGTLLYEMITGLPPFFNTNVHVMYERIMRAQLTFPAYVSPDAVSLLTGLLTRDPSRRLGGGLRDAEELKEHPYFRSIDWSKLYHKRLTPPFRPFNKDGITDVSNIDEEFRREVPKDTPVNPSALNKVQFPDFSYQAPEAGLAGEAVPME